MSATDGVRSTLTDVEHAIGVANGEIARLYAEQRAHCDNGQWNSGKQLCQHITGWKQWRADLMQYRASRLSATATVGTASSIDIGPWVALWQTLTREHDGLAEAAEHCMQFEHKRDPRPLVREVWRAWLTLDAFAKVAVKVTGDARFAELPRSPQRLPMFEGVFFDWRQSETRSPAADTSRWEDLLM